MARKVIITVDADGQVVVEADGFTDESCFAATKDFEELLGDVKSVEKKELTKGKALLLCKRGVPSGYCG